ncbi:glycoside hydrolase family 2 protein [Dactylosporangium vinaceum]|uniref:beta-mannosidase n=1 Tax=Dactylosporangium vinaceum TaxID=53362 RepID=A0ABV5MKY5_9ACTN|nr:glycoside hydrolase family 2 protein [Dactylosporangium vinaceum]UAB93983.1 glycoside hydrolase family 2 protein [Dactylosporangium vinaceum]
MRSRIDGGWTLRDSTGREFPATVPGCVHTDLLAAGAIADPHLGDNEVATQWIGHRDWRYRTTFDAAPGARSDLVFHGLDTLATITCNGVELGRTENMHRSYRFPVDGLLRAEGNELTVELASAERFAAARTAETGGDWPNPFHRPYPVIRKMACNFGWDWGPDLVTAGIWRPVELHTWHTARLASVRPVVTRAGDTWTVTVHVELEYADGPADVTVEASVAGVRACAPGPGAIALTVTDPALWWPAGHGEQPLYELEVRLSTGDSWRRRIGFRTVALDTGDDEIGSRFVLLVNDRPVFARGVNWIPDDTFVTRTGPGEYRHRLTQALDANVNLVRVWGGGLYETDAFYDVCDELGLLVWQDFPFACAAYPQDGRLAREVEAEAREAIVRLAPHPSLALWNGNNENIWGWFDWDWREPLRGRAWGESYYLDLLPRLVAELDPSRPYWAGSPYSGSMDRHPNDDRHGVSHVWNVWNEEDYLAYRGRTPRFVAEFGYSGPPTFSTYTRGIGDSADGHQKAADGDAKLDRGLADHFGTGRAELEFDDWLYLTQLVQARAVQVGVGHFRSAQPTCMGTVWWQLNDCWPGPSWAVIDGDRRRKPAWYALRDMYAPRLLSIQPGRAGLELVLVNDTDEGWAGTAAVTRHDFDGRALAAGTVAVSCPPRGVRRFRLLGEPGRPERELLRVAFDGRTADWFYREDRDLEYPPAEFTATADADGVTVTAATLLRDLCLFPDRLDPAAETDRMLVTLLPGETARFALRAAAPLPAAALVSAPVLRCVNDRYRCAQEGARLA